jgi:NAD(P)-dependent dehydrogenase (short-subunit alcohol dehydrogenase family)
MNATANKNTRAAIVTGGAKGIGAAICQAAARSGYRVGVLDLRLSDCEALVASLAGSGHVALQADVTDEQQVHAAFEKFAITPDVVVNNAGIVRFGLLTEQSVADFRASIGVNLIGTYIVAREAARRMKARRAGVIINMTSINALSPGPGSGAYPAAKAGVAKLTEQFSLELGEFGIRVNCIAPGFIDGGMSAPIYANQKIRDLRGGAVPLRRLGTVEDIANAVLWLASDESAYVTGHQLVVDGGVAHSVLLQLPRSVD